LLPLGYRNSTRLYTWLFETSAATLREVAADRRHLGADIGVLPEYRRLGLATLLYRARHDLIRRLNLKGHVAGGMLKGYGQHRDKLSVEEYVAKVVAGEMFDPTLSIQLKRGFTVHGIIQNYVDDPSCDGKAAFIVWYNPEYREA
jgi:GNAT superfamily N-acetyltransferase